MVDADLEFHHLIAVSSHNQFFAQAIVRQNALRRLTEMITTPESARLRQSSAEHVAILDALESGDRDGGSALSAGTPHDVKQVYAAVHRWLAAIQTE